MHRFSVLLSQIMPSEKLSLYFHEMLLLSMQKCCLCNFMWNLSVPLNLIMIDLAELSANIRFSACLSQDILIQLCVLFHGESLSITLLKTFKTFPSSNSPVYVNHSTSPVVIWWWLWRRNALLSLRSNISVSWYSDAHKIPEWPFKRLSKQTEVLALEQDVTESNYYYP